jgi:vancomycin aglycone glucosyltransferase
MRILLTSHGSTGDIYPIIGLAVALQRMGHHVRFATIPHYRAEIEAAGVEFHALCPDWRQNELSYWMGRLQRIRLPVAQLREIYRGALPHIPAMIERMTAALAETDVLVSSYLFPMNGVLAARMGVPFATFAFAHQTVPSPDYPPEGLALPGFLPRTVRRGWNRLLWSVGNFVVDRTINHTIRHVWTRTGLPPTRSFFSAPADLVLVGVSEKLMRPAAEVHPRFRWVGYCRWQAPESAGLEAEVKAFTGGLPVPVITFGSMVYDQPMETLRRFVAAWPAGRKAIVQSGWAGFAPLPEAPHVKVIGKVSHDQLFRHASVVVHHGGAGTTASVLHAGRPQIVVPHIGDQLFFGQEVERLECGFRLARRRWPETLASAVDRALGDARYVQGAARAAAVLATENGPARVEEELQRFVRSKQLAAGGANRRPPALVVR